MKRTLAALTVGALGVALVPAAAGAQDDANTIVDVAVAASQNPDGSLGFDSDTRDYDVLIAALLATPFGDDGGNLADAVATLDDITVFAPTDHAFIELAEDLSGGDIANEEAAFNFVAANVPGELLLEILLYHVAPDARSVFRLRFAGDIPTLAGDDKTVDVFFNRVRDQDPDDRDARIRRPRNLRADNGIIHTVDRVLRPSDLDAPPPPTDTILDVVLAVSGPPTEDPFLGLDGNGSDYDILRSALVAAGLTGAVADPDADLTVFAPTDDAFIKLAQDLGFEGNDEAGALAAILDVTGFATDPTLLTNILLYHVAPGGQTVQQLNFLRPVETLLPGESVRLFFNIVIDADFNDRDARIVSPSDLATSNGVIQTVDRVLRPIDLP
ncbi:MAG: fasciclin domain-containing protein [Actinomycetota bacterium]